jgi:hypothetical protein
MDGVVVGKVLRWLAPPACVIAISKISATKTAAGDHLNMEH